MRIFKIRQFSRMACRIFVMRNHNQINIKEWLDDDAAIRAQIRHRPQHDIKGGLAA